MNSSNNPTKSKITIQEVDSDSEIQETSTTNNSYASSPYNPQYYDESKHQSSGTLSIYNAESAIQHAKIFNSSIKQQTKTTDDSSTAYGENYARSFGDRSFAPMPEPSAPMEDEEWTQYQAWMHAPTFADRSKLPGHKRFTDILNRGQEKFRLEAKNVSRDYISEAFRQKVENGAYPNIFTGPALPPKYTEMQYYLAPAHKSQIEHKQEYIDQVQDMIAYTDKEFKISYASSKFGGREIASNAFFVVSDHDGASTGSNIQIWGGGAKKSFFGASIKSKQKLDRVEGSEDSYDITTNYVHIPNRFTIIRINNNEIGFILDRSANTILKMKEGRYVILEKEFAYIGKAELNPSNNVISVVIHANNKDNYINNLAAQLQILLVPQGSAAFISDNKGTYVLQARPEPYILDKRRAEKFINYTNINAQVIRATDDSYTIINQLQPGQFITFQHESRTIVWFHDENNERYNSLYLPNNQFRCDGLIHNVNDNRVEINNVNIVNMQPGQTLVVRDDKRQIRFIENAQAETFVLRSPWQFIGLISQNEVDFRTGLQKKGNEVVRLMLRNSEWAAVLDKTGHLSFYPPKLDNEPYYFLQPEHTVIQIINKNTLGETKLDVPGIGAVSVVNIPSGSIGAARINNMHFMLNPSPSPYIMVPPDAFMKIIDATESHTQIADLHRIVLKPEQRAVISKDGKLYRLPAENHEVSAALSEENGVYVFRSFQFVVYGPENKSTKSYALGPIQYFNVGVGEVAYGTVAGKLKIWESGEHSVDTRKNEWFRDFFSTNVDPVQINKLPVTFQHGITGSVDVYVSYNIVNPEKAIQKFGKHDILHQFIEETSSSEMLKLCPSRPPLGYTDLIFSTAESKASTEKTEEIAFKAVQEMESSFMKHAAELLEEYGVRISNMYIGAWQLAPDFVLQVQANAKLLQNAHAKIEQARMALEQSDLTNKQEIQRRNAEILLKKSENERLALELDADRLRKLNVSQSEADAQILNAKTQAGVDEQKALGLAAAASAETKISAQNSIIQAEARAKVAEQNALGETAAQRIQSATLLQTAETQLNAKKMEVEAKLLEINSIKQRGMTEAEVEAAKMQAKYEGLTPEQRMQLQLAKISSKNMGELLSTLITKGVQMPGAVTIDPRVFELMQMPLMSNSNPFFQNSSAQPFLLFKPKPVTSTLEESKLVHGEQKSVLSTPPTENEQTSPGLSLSKTKQ